MATSKSSTKTPATKSPATTKTKAVTKASSPVKKESVIKAAPKAEPKAPAKAAPRKAAAKPARPKAVAGVPAEQRRNYIEMAAYYIAERRGFAPGNLLDDWVQAEAEIDRLLAEGRLGS